MTNTSFIRHVLDTGCILKDCADRIVDSNWGKTVFIYFKSILPIRSFDFCSLECVWVQMMNYLWVNEVPLSILPMYKVIRIKLGKGGFACVWLCESKHWSRSGWIGSFTRGKTQTALISESVLTFLERAFASLCLLFRLWANTASELLSFITTLSLASTMFICQLPAWQLQPNFPPA